MYSNYKFKPDTFKPNLPHSIELGDVAGISVDNKDNIYLFNRSKNPIIVLNPKGELLRTWGHGIFKNPHGSHIGFDQNIYLTDNGDHTVRKFTLDGKLLLQIGIPDTNSGFMSGKPFCKCTHSALSPEGDIIVSDGYGNAVIHIFDQNGKHIKSWGKPGTSPGEFNLPHNVCCDNDGFIYVADRENSRVQIFNSNGKFEKQIVNMHRPSGLAITPGFNPDIIVGELASYLKVNKNFPNLGPYLSIFNSMNDLLYRIGNEGKPSLAPGMFVSPHSIAYDSLGNIYVGDVAETDWDHIFKNQKKPKNIRRFQRFIRTGMWKASLKKDIYS